MIVVNHQIEIHNTGQYPKPLLLAIQNDLTFANPAYEKAIKYGNGQTSTPKTISLFRWETGEGKERRIILPRGYGTTLRKRCKQHRVPWDMKDERLTLPPVVFHSSIQPRDYQEVALLSDR